MTPTKEQLLALGIAPSAHVCGDPVYFENAVLAAVLAERRRCADVAKDDLKMSERNMNNYAPTDQVGRLISAGSSAAGRRIAAAILGVDQFDID